MHKNDLTKIEQMFEILPHSLKECTCFSRFVLLSKSQLLHWPE